MLSKRALSLKPSPTLALVAKAKELSSKGHDVISLSVGEPDWPTFAIPSEAGIAAIKSGFSKYTLAAGIPELREAICKQVKTDINVEYKISQVTVSTGAKFVLFAAFQMLFNEGDEVIIPAPYWVSYPVMAELAGGVPVIVDCGADVNFKLSAAQLEKAITKKTKALVLCSPSNPTGLVYSKQELTAIAEVLKKHPHVVMISDDIYNRLMLTEGTFAPHILQVAPELKERTLLINGVSKTYAMTGWRIGWALGPQALITAMADYQSQSTSSACSISQKAALEAIKHCDGDVEKSVGVLKERLNSTLKSLENVPLVRAVKPEGAFYVWLDISKTFGKSFEGKKIENSRDFATLLLEKYFVAAVPGLEFGTEGYMRLSFAIETPRMVKAIDRMKTLINELV
jgi:aspartate aminotransferase